MTQEEIDHMIEYGSAQVEQDEALAKILMARAQDARMYLGVIKQQREENKQLLENQRVTRVNIENFNGSYIEKIKYAELCQQLSTTSTEPTSNTSSSTSTPNITPLKRIT